MKIQALLMVVLGTLAVGCSGDADPETTTAKTPSSTVAEHDHSASEKTMKPSPDAANLGTKLEKEHFSVTLKTEPAEPKMGKTNFIAEVWHHGEPAPGQSVQVETSMPTMNMDGPKVELRTTTGNVYEGSADLPMGGEYEAKVTVGGASSSRWPKSCSKRIATPRSVSHFRAKSLGEEHCEG